ncbi:spore coat protein [Halalkalibacter krulwichiae]|uniref:Inner spore coat protein D n=1 Tax=Halalkalibacter krulwichiae TaxID=199441 RepID=A0A1X9MAH4_9BACI|nr:spore coat protein [Halalkalibacter krulwichiae]ARK30408.1 Inner spore coat protein D [Halalkalibacter krulwichiae]
MFCKPRPNVCKLPTTTQVMPAQVAPTQQQIVDKTCEYIVPHVFPSHTHYNTNHVYKHVASFPHTTSQSQQVFNQQFVGGPQVAGAMSPGPGMGPGMGPGFGPQVAGAMSPGPGMGPGYGPQVAGAMSPYGKKCGR